MELNRLLLTLALRGGRYRFLKASGFPGRVEALSMEVTRRCVARCVMCNIWRMRPTTPELQAGDWLKLLEDPVLSKLKELDITGGEPFLRNDLVDLLLGIGRLKSTHLGCLSSVAITTNGLLTGKVLDDVGRVIAPLEEVGVDLVQIAVELVEALLVGHARGAGVAQPPFAEDAGGVPRFLQDFGDRNVLRQKRCPAAVDSHGGVAAVVPGHQHAA